MYQWKKISWLLCLSSIAKLFLPVWGQDYKQEFLLVWYCLECYVLIRMKPGIINYKQFKFPWICQGKIIKICLKYIAHCVRSFPIKRIPGYRKEIFPKPFVSMLKLRYRFYSFGNKHLFLFRYQAKAVLVLKINIYRIMLVFI